MCYWLQSRYYPDGFDGNAAPWSTVTWPEFFTMLTVSVTAWIGAIRSCARVRCGAAVPSQMWECVWKEVGRLGHVNWASGFRKPDSVSSAFARLYWRDCCSSVMLYWVLLGSGMLMTSFFSGTSSWDLGAIVFLFSFLPSLLVSLNLGNSLESRQQMKGYLAVVPLADRDIAFILVRAILKLVVISVTSMLFLGLAGGSLVSLLLQGFETTRESGAVDDHGRVEIRVDFPWLSAAAVILGHDFQYDRSALDSAAGMLLHLLPSSRSDWFFDRDS